MDCGSTILMFFAFMQAIYGQELTLTGPSAIERGSNTVFTCNEPETQASYSFSWRDATADIFIYASSEKIDTTVYPKYTNFVFSEDGAGTSTMRIQNAEIEDEGTYRCIEGLGEIGVTFTVEVAHTYSSNVSDPIVEGTMYNVTCDATNGRPDVTISWTLDGNTPPCINMYEETLTAPVNLSSKRRVCTLQADKANNGDEFKCIFSGHQISSLNGEESSTLNIEYAPLPTNIMEVDIQVDGSDLLVTCNVVENGQPNPRITFFYIFANDTMVIHQSTNGDNSGSTTAPTSVTDFRCVAGNYLGNTTAMATYDPTRTTTPPTPTEPSTPEGFNTVSPTPAVQTTATTPMAGDNNETDGLSGAPDLGPGAIAGIVIGAIVVIVIIIIVIIFCLKKGSRGSSSSGVSAKKHTSSTVGTSNGSEKEKIKPVAAPRDQGSIQHTTDNPGQAEYAMVDRKKSGGGDMPDTRGPSHDSPGMHYADLDLSTNAGHTERQVPQNPDNVVVYSSILV